MTVSPRALRVLQAVFSSGWTIFGLIAVAVAGVVTWEMLHPGPMASINAALWIVTNLILFWGYIALTAYVLLYGWIFQWYTIEATGQPNIGGRLIFNLTTSLESVVLLLVLQIFLIPTSGRPFWEAPPEPFVLLPSLRFLAYTWVVVTITAMLATLIRRIVTLEPLNVNVPPRASDPDDGVTKRR